MRRSSERTGAVQAWDESTGDDDCGSVDTRIPRRAVSACESGTSRDGGDGSLSSSSAAPRRSHRDGGVDDDGSMTTKRYVADVRHPSDAIVIVRRRAVWGILQQQLRALCGCDNDGDVNEAATVRQLTYVVRARYRIASPTRSRTDRTTAIFIIYYSDSCASAEAAREIYARNWSTRRRR